MTEFYRGIADWWPVISPPSEYAAEADLYVDMIYGTAQRPVHEVLELGSGGGNNASHMKRKFDMTLVEPEEGMRKVSRTLNPECTHLSGDMRDVRLGRTFDAVFVHDAVEYMTTEDDLRAALATVAVHLAPDGVALVAPDATRETFEGMTEHGGGADEGGRTARYLQWTLPPEPGETSYTVQYAFLLREPDGDGACSSRHPSLWGIRACNVATTVRRGGALSRASTTDYRGRRVRLVYCAAQRAVGTR